MTVDPLTVVLETARAALLAAGLARCEAGGTVYFAGGSGPAVVLVHGVNDHAGTWAPVVPALVRKYRLIIPDLAGHGESEPRSGPIPMPLIVDRLAAVIEKEGATNVTLAGNSMGAWVSILYALDHPDRVRALLLESGGGIAHPLSAPLTAKTREEAATILYAVHGRDTAITDWAVDAILQRSTDSPLLRILQTGLAPHLVDARLPQIRVPTTVVWGARDGVVPRAYVERVQQGIPGAKLTVIEGAAHIPHAQQPERFIECLTATF